MAVNQVLITPKAKFDRGDVAGLPLELLHHILGHLPCDER